jgi:Na+/H+-dicarboxylate symporter
MGLLLGLIGRGSSAPFFAELARGIRPAGDVWLAVLQIVALPLVVANLLAAITGARGSESVAAAGLRAVGLFVVMLVAVGLITVAISPPILSAYKPDPATVESLRTADLAAPSRAAPAGRLFPRRLLDAIRGGDFLPILLVTALAGFGVTRLPERNRLPLARLFQRMANALLRVAHAILLLTPLGVFALAYPMALKIGINSVGMLATFLLIVTGFLLFFTILLYPVTVLLGRTDLRSFARAVLPAQLVAVTSRSSLASLPALVEGGREHLDLPESSTGFVLPLAVSVFKINRTISSTLKLLFLAHVYGIALTPATVATFVVTVIFLSFSIAGVPNSTAMVTMPAYLAAGIPIGGVVLLDSVMTVQDIFRTLLNVTGDMSVATLLSRSSRKRAVAAPAAGEVAASAR